MQEPCCISDPRGRILLPFLVQSCPHPKHRCGRHQPLLSSPGADLAVAHSRDGAEAPRGKGDISHWGYSKESSLLSEQRIWSLFSYYAEAVLRLLL